MFGDSDAFQLARQEFEAASSKHATGQDPTARWLDGDAAAYTRIP